MPHHIGRIISSSTGKTTLLLVLPEKVLIVVLKDVFSQFKLVQQSYDRYLSRSMIPKQAHGFYPTKTNTVSRVQGDWRHRGGNNL
jgi:hypothetical protein